ncbi:MAG: glycosyltransferase family 4 protein [Acidobacteriia bacterium]|nr:glycosyltransferase family 4 protein [Terriglobia bacterium]
MRVTIDAVPLLYRSAGVKNYLYYWIRNLRREAADIDLRLFPFLGEPSSLDHEASPADPLTTLARLGLMFWLNRIPTDLSRWLVPRADVFHASKLRYPPRGPKLTATVHDLTWRLMPGMHSQANVAAEHVFAENVLRRADGIIAVSEATRADAVRILRLAPEKIRVIHHGIAEGFFEAAPRKSERPYVLFVGTIEPRKNVPLLLDAWAALPASLRAGFDLVLAGPAGWRQRETLARLADPPAGVRYLGYVPEQDLPGLFAGATVFVYPSLYEGFGFPVAQAMAAGAPVITAGVSALPEIAGGAALLVDPHSEAELRGAMAELLISPARRASMSEQGRKNAQRFTWRECARKSAQFFHDTAGV